jgi:hypothetical protein
MTLTRDDILRPSPRRYDAIPWIGGSLRIQSLSGGEMRQLRDSFIDGKGNAIKERISRQRAILLCWCIVDDAGNRIFSDADSQSPSWDTIDGKLLEAAYDRCRKWTGFLADADWSAIEDAAKNSESTRENS